MCENLSEKAILAIGNHHQGHSLVWWDFRFDPESVVVTLDLPMASVTG
jgi:hypothetical protein